MRLSGGTGVDRQSACLAGGQGELGVHVAAGGGGDIGHALLVELAHQMHLHRGVGALEHGTVLGQLHLVGAQP